MHKSLLITYFFPPKIGGLENYLFNICKGLPKDKIIVLMDSASLSKSNDFQKEDFCIYQTKFFAWKFLKPSWLPLSWKIYRLIKKEKIKILQFGHYAHYCLIGTLLAKLLKLKILIYFHGIDLWIHQRKKIGRWLMKLNLENADKLIANSNFIKNEIFNLGIPKEKIVVIYPGINVEKFKNLNNKKSGDLINKKIILSLGRLIKLKGYDLVLKALPEVIRVVPNLVYLIIGEGKEEKELRELVKKLDLEKYVNFIEAIKGPEETRASYYALADVFVGPSREIIYKDYKHVESFGLVYLEAAAAEKPVIATRIGGIKEAVLDGQTGLLVPPENPQALAQALIKLLTDEELAKRLGRQGRKRVEKEFRWEQQIEKILKLLD